VLGAALKNPWRGFSGPTSYTLFHGALLNRAAYSPLR